MEAKQHFNQDLTSSDIVVLGILVQLAKPLSRLVKKIEEQNTSR